MTSSSPRQQHTHYAGFSGWVGCRLHMVCTHMHAHKCSTRIDIHICTHTHLHVLTRTPRDTFPHMFRTDATSYIPSHTLMTPRPSFPPRRDTSHCPRSRFHVITGTERGVSGQPRGLWAYITLLDVGFPPIYIDLLMTLIIKGREEVARRHIA